MGRGPTVPGSLVPPAGLVSPAEPQPASLAALTRPRARRTMARGRWRLQRQREQQEHNQRQPQPPQPPKPQPPRGRRNRGWTRWHNRLNDGGSTNRYDQALMRFRKNFCGKLFRRWAAKARNAPQLRLLGPAFRQWRAAFWLWRVAPWRAFHTPLCRVILGRWAAVAREAVRTRAGKARRWAARTRIAWPAFWACFWAWFTAARAGTLLRLRAEVGVRSTSWPP